LSTTWRGQVAGLGLAHVVGAALAAALTAAAVSAYTGLRVWRRGQLDDGTRQVDAIVVLGAAHRGGRPLPVFAARLDHAVDLFAAGVARRVIVSGGRREGDAFTEAEVARAYLAARGIPGEAMIAETAALDTAESLSRVASLMRKEGLNTAMLVSDRTHMLRALLIAHHLGIPAYGSPTPSSPADRHPAACARATVHELGALACYSLRSLLGRLPRAATAAFPSGAKFRRDSPLYPLGDRSAPSYTCIERRRSRSGVAFATPTLSRRLRGGSKQ
jgi:uncharacterized SAM-binding protein YcdF (DUF218 family)